MKKMKRGKGNAKSKRQAVAIGLSEARRSGVKLKAQPRSKRQAKPTKAKTTTTRKKTSATRSRTKK